MPYNEDNQPASGAPALPNSVAELIKRLTQQFRHFESEVWKEVAGAGGVMLESKLTKDDKDKKHKRFLTLDKHIEGMVNLRHRTEYQDDIEFSNAVERTLLDVDLSIIRALGNQGLLTEFLNAGGESLTWLFARPLEDVFEQDSILWARKAMDHNRPYYRAVIRFWEIFMNSGVQAHVIESLSDGLPMVSLAHGDYWNTIRICNAYIRRYQVASDQDLAEDSDSDSDSVLLIAHYKSYKASALSCLGFGQSADDLFDEIESELKQCRDGIGLNKDEFDVARRNPKTLASRLSIRLRLALRERLRSEIRKTWIDLYDSGWPGEPAPRVRHALAIKMLDEFRELVLTSTHQLEPTDFDTLARATIILHPKGVESNGDQVLKWINTSKILYETQAHAKVEGSKFSDDTIKITEALYWIAKKQTRHVRRLRQELFQSQSLKERQHSAYSLRAIMKYAPR